MRGWRELKSTHPFPQKKPQQTNKKKTNNKEPTQCVIYSCKLIPTLSRFRPCTPTQYLKEKIVLPCLLSFIIITKASLVGDHLDVFSPKLNDDFSEAQLGMHDDYNDSIINNVKFFN